MGATLISASKGVCSEEFATDKAPYLIVLESNYNRKLIGTRVVLAHSDIIVLHFKVSYRNQYQNHNCREKECLVHTTFYPNFG